METTERISAKRMTGLLFSHFVPDLRRRFASERSAPALPGGRVMQVDVTDHNVIGAWRALALSRSSVTVFQ